MTNLHKHLRQGHSGKYKEFFETEATKQEDIEANLQASVQAKLKQVSLQDLAEKKAVSSGSSLCQINNSPSNRYNSD